MKGKITGLILIGVGVIIAIGTVVMHFVDAAADRRHTEQTTGKITHVDTQRTSKRTEYCPTVSFSANGSQQKFVDDCSSTHVYVGETMNVYYNPADPSDASTTKGDEWFTDVAGGVVAVGIMAYGAFQIYRGGGSSGGLLGGLGGFGRPRQTWSPAPGAPPAPGAGGSMQAPQQSWSSAPGPPAAPGAPSAPPSAAAPPGAPSGEPRPPAAPGQAPQAAPSGPPPFPPGPQTATGHPASPGQPSPPPPPSNPPSDRQTPPGPPPLPPSGR